MDYDFVKRSRRQLVRIGYLANGFGATVVTISMLWLAPSIATAELNSITTRTLPAFALYLLFALPLGHFLYRRAIAPIERWVIAGKPPTDADRLSVLRYPRRWATDAFWIWAGGAAFFTALNSSENAFAAVGGGIVIVLGALTACSLQYVLVEKALRPIAALTLAGSLPTRRDYPGVRSRLVLAWVLTTGIPLAGIVVLSAAALISGVDTGRILVAVLFLALTGLSVGLASVALAGATVSAPLRALRDALARVEDGDFSARVPVDDATEAGFLQAGFNRMTRGLSEREQLHEALGVYVDPSLAERVINEGLNLSGEEINLTVLFMDVRNFTSYAEDATPQQVVARLNDLYGHVVPVLLRHRGHANKFIGDGLLAVFGAPERVDDHAECAVAAALEIVALVESNYGEKLRVGVGINSGPVVAGTIGGGGRLDFTVIGDTVNTASRVESATKTTGDDVLITEATFRLLHEPDDYWSERPDVDLKGKQQQVRLYGPSREPLDRSVQRHGG